MIALDTNLLVHAHRQDSGLHAQASALVRRLAEGAAIWAIPLHCFVEFYGVATHRGIWKTPSTPVQAQAQIVAWCESPTLRVLSDEPEALDRLFELCVHAQVAGPKVHDGRIAAVCLEHGISELWTVDRDFSRFPALCTRNPLAAPSL
jgi:toxin-antitoxin system PIN domain toxin